MEELLIQFRPRGVGRNHDGSIQRLLRLLKKLPHLRIVEDLSDRRLLEGGPQRIASLVVDHYDRARRKKPLEISCCCKFRRGN